MTIMGGTAGSASNYGTAGNPYPGSSTTTPATLFTKRFLN
jgi:hypothetical protein